MKTIYTFDYVVDKDGFRELKPAELLPPEPTYKPLVVSPRVKRDLRELVRVAEKLEPTKIPTASGEIAADLLSPSGEVVGRAAYKEAYRIPLRPRSPAGYARLARGLDRLGAFFRLLIPAVE